MTRREVEQWVKANHLRLRGRGVEVYFSFGPAFDRKGELCWASFLSKRGSGRLIRQGDGSSRVDAFAFVDGSCLRREHAAEVSSGQLEGLADLLTARVGRQ